MMSLIPTDYRYKRHFRLCHIKHAVVVARITLLACKCSQVKSQGTDYSCRNQHYHCHLCHWPKTSKQALFIHYSTQHDLAIEVIGHLVERLKKNQTVNNAVFTVPYFIKLHRHVDALLLFFVIYITELLITLEIFTCIRFTCIFIKVCF